MIRTIKFIKGIFLVLLTSGFFMAVNFLDRNILDAMYLDALEGGFSFNHVKEAKYTDNNRQWAFSQFNFFRTEYDRKFLRAGYNVRAAYSVNRPNIFEVEAQLALGTEARLSVKAEYDYHKTILSWAPLAVIVPSKDEGTLNYKLISKRREVIPYLMRAGVTKEAVEEAQDYILKRVVLKTWAKGNCRFPFHLLRGIQVIRHTWDFTA